MNSGDGRCGTIPRHRRASSGERRAGAKVSKLEEEREQYRKLYQQMLEKAKKLERGLLGQKAERLPPCYAQLSLQLLAGLLGEREAALDAEPEAEDSGAQPEPEHEPERPKPTPTGRRRMPKNLPVVKIELIPDDVVEKGLKNFDRVGEEAISTIERRPSSFVVCEVHRPKF